MRSLSSQRSPLASGHEQLKILSQLRKKHPAFSESLQDSQLQPLRARSLRVLQLNLGKMCNQTCLHCHVDAGPDRREMMSDSVIEACLRIVSENQIPVVDLTGGAPEMHPQFRDLVKTLRKMNVHVMDRCNLTILTANSKYRELPQFLGDHQVEVVSSLPHYSQKRTDSQRGDGVFAKSIEGLRLLNEVGYGSPESGLVLNLVYNPTGAFLPGSQETLEKEFKARLARDFEISFNSLFCITNMPISRYLQYLLESGNLEDYMEKLIAAYSPSAAANVMCRDMLSISWDGQIYDCDFNQMLDLGLSCTESRHVDDFSIEAVRNREIAVHEHCYGCTAGQGSSCGGQIGS